MQFSLCHVVLETMPVELYGRSHPAPKPNSARVIYFKKFQSSRTSGVKGRRGSRVSYEVQGFRRSLKVDGFKNFLIQGVQGSEGQRVSRHVGIYL